MAVEALTQNMEKTIEEVRQLILLPHTTVRLLLNQFKWDKEKMLEAYYSDNQLDRFAAAAAVVTKSKPDNDVIECEICYMECHISNRY